MKKILTLFVLLSSMSVFADPCNYLSQRQCYDERAYCNYQRGVVTKGRCVAVDRGREQICRQAHILTSLGEQAVENECYRKMAITNCEWIPAQQKPSGCYLKQSIRRR